MDLTNRRGIITGAGQGIGKGLALAFAAQGAHLLLVGRKQETLVESARLVQESGGSAEILVQDLSDAGAVEAVRAAVESWASVDLLVNNAGNVRAGRLEDSTAEDTRSMIDLNLTAPLLLTQALLPELRASGATTGSIILNISSEIALVGMPFYAVYAATKSGLAGFGESLRRELHGSGVHVATVYPGATDTAMMSTQNAGWARGTVDGVVLETMTALASGTHEINTTSPDSRQMQQLNRTDSMAVDTAIAPGLDELEQSVRDHNSI